ncbi:uncharacterized protein B0H18DRAFT_1127536 [Fomitopsis serialis]|uniref:uncharacterized protein n=1 Tax=Fomitopsis serialis TaxID=139415 RepID=UPI002008D5A9|nr:uncharacterized protein B0H18DRAFT_1127536 [Neoantrodia serialis]KAH9912169.1 hypothetical protein B0H18DRAFT_1127536 [Neoantrodia serialis]
MEATHSLTVQDAASPSESTLTELDDISAPGSEVGPGDCQAQMVLPDIAQDIVKTSYDAQHSHNLVFPAPRGDHTRNIAWTETARRQATRASKPNDLEELGSQLAAQYSEGYKADAASYVRVPLECVAIIHRDMLTIRGINDELVCVCTSMPDTIKSTLTEKLYALQVLAKY